MRDRDPLLPHAPGGMAPGAAISLAVHVGLVAALALSVNWRMRQTEVVSAELWSALPQVAPPRAEAPPPPPAPVPAPKPAPPPPAPAPAPPPREAQIATERAEKKAREDKEAADRADKAEKLKKQREEEAKKQAEEQRMAKLREDQMQRMLGSLKNNNVPPLNNPAEKDSAPSQDYANRLVALLRSNVVFPDDLKGNPAVDIEVRAAPGGTIIGRRIVKASGVPEWDEAALRAVDRTARLPAQADGRVPGAMIITFKPKP